MARKRILKHFGFTVLVGTIVARFSPLLNSACRLTTANGEPLDRIWIGNYGEKVASIWLKSQGCKILAKNYRGPRKGEVDIIARDGKLLLFVEVKTRRAGNKIRGFDAVGVEKQKLIERGANSWLKRLGTRNLPWRFDFIEVCVEEGKKPQVNQIKDAF